VNTKAERSRPTTGRLVATGGVLLALAALSYGLSFAPLGPFAIAVALGIGVVKAIVVASVFMELRERSASFQLALVAALLLLATMISLVVTDVTLRAPTLRAPPPRIGVQR
jgi:cytochrome c oxidase subunit 4